MTDFRACRASARALLGAPLLLALLLTLSACGREAPSPAAPTGPTETVESWFRLAHENDIDGLFRSALTAESYDRMRERWREWREEVEFDDGEAARFAETMTKLTSEGAEQRLYDELEPSLLRMETEFAAQLPLMLAMGSGFLSAGIQENEQLTEDQKRHANEAIGALVGWLAGAPLTDRDKARVAAAEVVSAARTLGLDRIEQLRELDFDAAMAKLAVISASGKTILALYGLDLDASLSGSEATLIEQDGDRASVRVSYPLAASKLSYIQELIEIDGRWYDPETRGSLDLLFPDDVETDGVEPDHDEHDVDRDVEDGDPNAAAPE